MAIINYASVLENQIADWNTLDNLVEGLRVFHKLFGVLDVDFDLLEGLVLDLLENLEQGVQNHLTLHIQRILSKPDLEYPELLIFSLLPQDLLENVHQETTVRIMLFRVLEQYHTINIELDVFIFLEGPQRNFLECLNNNPLTSAAFIPTNLFSLLVVLFSLSVFKKGTTRVSTSIVLRSKKQMTISISLMVNFMLG